MSLFYVAFISVRNFNSSVEAYQLELHVADSSFPLRPKPLLESSNMYNAVRQLLQ